MDWGDPDGGDAGGDVFGPVRDPLPSGDAEGPAGQAGAVVPWPAQQAVNLPPTCLPRLSSHASTHA